MVEQNLFYENYEKIKKRNPSEKEVINYTGSYIFVSFDIVNSTYFKTISKKWIKIFKSFFHEAKTQILTENENNELKFEEWKTLGDEILFYSPITDIKKILKIHERIFKIMKVLINKLEEEDEAKGILSVKSGLWIAYLVDDDFKYKDKEPKNIILKEKIIKGYKLEFLGSDIDIGFRILKYAQQNKLVICAKLAYILTIIRDYSSIKDENLSKLIEVDLDKNNMKIVSYEQLKGVWNNKYYPIIWYFDNWQSENLFQYDERYSSDIIDRLEKDINSADKISKLEKIFNDLNRESEIKDLLNGINEYSSNNPEGIIPAKIEDDKLSELHLATICFNKDNNKVLITKRTDARNCCPSKWEFGCAKLRLDKNFEESIKEDYKKELSVILSFYKDNLLPISRYELQKEDRVIQGLIFIAKTSTKNIKLNKIKYSEFRWISLKELKNIKEKDAVNDFHKNIKKAFELVKNYQ